jgi:1-deoxy-D-xylulose-5-phosphate reductoisomerase
VSTGIAILGSTGSIGQSTLRVLERQRDRFHVVALTANASASALEDQGRAWGAKLLGLVDVAGGADAQAWQRRGNGRCRRAMGPASLIEAATHPEVGIVVNAVVGAAGLEATLAALAAGKRVALANKETLVMAGELVLSAARDGGEIVPVDSEHSGVLQCITGRPTTEVARLILTASGGPFRRWSAERIASASVEDALRHPTWSMGPKITVDSATLANKALEVIEAHHLFGLGYDAIDVVVHPQSIVHAFTEFVDGSILAQVGVPCMELPIAYALTHPDRVADNGVERFDPIRFGQLTFEAVRRDDFPTYALGVQAGRAGETAPAAFNAANEVAVQAFLNRRIRFGRIGEVIDHVLQRYRGEPASDLACVLAVDHWARVTAEEACS